MKKIEPPIINFFSKTNTYTNKSGWGNVITQHENSASISYEKFQVL